MIEWHKLWILQFAAWTATVLQPCLASFSWYVFPKEDFSHYLRWFCQMLPRDSFFLSHCICVACTNIGDSYSAKSKNTDYRQRLWICKSVYFMFQKWVLGELVSSGSCRCYLASECSGSWLERSWLLSLPSSQYLLSGIRCTFTPGHGFPFVSDQVLACLLEFILPEVFFKSLSQAVHGDQASLHPKTHFAFDLTEAEENVRTSNTSCVSFFDDWPLLPLWWCRQAFVELFMCYRSQTTSHQRRATLAEGKLSHLGSFLSLCREVSYLASFGIVLFIFTDLQLKSNKKYPNSHVNIQYFWQLRDKSRCSTEHFWKT